jgi:2-cysteine adaptor domain
MENIGATFTVSPSGGMRRIRNPLTDRTLSPDGRMYKFVKRVLDGGDELLREWSFKPNVNPITHKTISPTGGIYKTLHRLASQAGFIVGGSRASQRIKRPASPNRPNSNRVANVVVSERKTGLRRRDSLAVCRQWNRNKSVNPRTGTKISRHSEEYRALRRECNSLPKKPTAARKSPTFVKRSRLMTVAQRLEYFTVVAQMLHDELYRKDSVCVEAMDTAEDGTFSPFEYRKRLASPTIDFRNMHSYTRVWAVRHRHLDFCIEERTLTEYERGEYAKGRLTVTHAMRLLNTVVTKRQSPHFVISGQQYECKKADGAVKSLVTPMELYDGNLERFIRESGYALDARIACNVFFQLLQGLATVQHQYGARLYFTTQKSIVVRRITPGGYWVYNFRGTKFYLPNEGVIVAFADVSDDTLAMKPSMAGPSKLYGTRGIIREGPNLDRISNFTAKLIDIPGNDELLPAASIDRFLPTMGTRYKQQQTSVPITKANLEDVDRYPLQDFVEDISNLVSLFFGEYLDQVGVTVAPLHEITIRPAKDNQTRVWLERVKSMFRDRHAFTESTQLYGILEQAEATGAPWPIPYYYYSASQALVKLFGDIYNRVPEDALGMDPIEVYTVK